jgi:hypothetical protein
MKAEVKTKYRGLSTSLRFGRDDVRLRIERGDSYEEVQERRCAAMYLACVG